MSLEVKCDKQYDIATKLGQKNPWFKFMIKMMTFTEVKGHQRSNMVNYVLWLPWSEESLMQGYDDLNKGQRSPEVKFREGQWLNGVKYTKLCFMATNSVIMTTDDNDDLHRGERSPEVKFREGQWLNGVKYTKLCFMATNSVIRPLMTMMIFIEVKGQQR